jgi:hypothetical protein
MSLASTVRKRALAALLLALLAALSWWSAPRIARHLVYTGPERQRSEQSAAPDPGELQVLVAEALPSLGLDDDQRQERRVEALEDPNGSWEAIHERWRLATDADALAMGRRLEALVASADPSAEIYLVERESQQLQLRFYAGTRLAVVLELEPSLGPWPRLAPGSQPLLSLVVYQVDRAPHAVRQLMEQGRPLALALSPYSPFSLRFSRDALLTHAEVLALAEPEVSLAEALEAVPHASGLLVTCNSPGDPDAQARALALEDVYVLDAVEGGMGAHWLRAFQNAGVPYLRTTTIDADTPELSRRRYRHTAAQRGAAVVVSRAGEATEEALHFEQAALRGYRWSFPAEQVEAARR